MICDPSNGQTILHLYCLPSSLAKDHNACYSKNGFSNTYREVHTRGAKAGNNRQQISKRNLQYPEAKEIQDGWRPRIACAVERLTDHHAIAIEDIAQAHNLQALHTISNGFRIGSENHNYFFRQ